MSTKPNLSLEEMIDSINQNKEEILSGMKRHLNWWHENEFVHPIGTQQETMFGRVFYGIEPFNDIKLFLGGHQPGMDFIVRGCRISAKSLTMKGKNNPIISMSSSRTGQYKSVEEKHSFFAERKEDCVIGLIHSQEDNSRTRTHTYELVVCLPLPITKVPSTTWKITGTPENISGYTWDADGINFKITKATSDQLWIAIPYDSPYVKKIGTITISQYIPEFIETDEETKERKKNENKQKKNKIGNK